MTVAVERAVSLGTDEDEVLDAVFELRNRWEREREFAGADELTAALCDFAAGAQQRHLPGQAHLLGLLGLHCSDADNLASEQNRFDPDAVVHHIPGLRAYDFRRDPSEEVTATCGAALIFPDLHLVPCAAPLESEPALKDRLCEVCARAQDARRAAADVQPLPRGWAGPARRQTAQALREWAFAQLDAGVFTNPDFWAHASTLTQTSFLDWTVEAMRTVGVNTLYDSALDDEVYVQVERAALTTPVLAGCGPQLRELFIDYLDGRCAEEDNRQLLDGLGQLCLGAVSSP